VRLRGALRGAQGHREGREERAISSDTHVEVAAAAAQAPVGGLRVKRSVTIGLGAFAREALTAVQMNGRETAKSVVRAIGVYLNDRGSTAPGWAYPTLMREGHRPVKTTKVEISVDDDLWRLLEEEAASQGVTSQQLVDHAVLYLAAEIDAGRLAQRLLGDLGKE
jgi:hypothetical protein